MTGFTETCKLMMGNSNVDRGPADDRPPFREQRDTSHQQRRANDDTHPFLLKHSASSYKNKKLEGKRIDRKRWRIGPDRPYHDTRLIDNIGPDSGFFNISPIDVRSSAPLSSCRDLLASGFWLSETG
nr:hypothetical protein CFP56_77761 [Quercus suber]